MPELPDITIYLEALSPRTLGRTLDAIRIGNPFVLRTVTPPRAEFAGRSVVGLSRIGKRIVFEFEEDLFAVIHLMIAGRLKWASSAAKIPRKSGLAAFDFDSGTLLLTEAGSKRRASIHLLRGREALKEIDPGGAEVFDIDLVHFRELLLDGNHTLKRAMTEPRRFAGIGNAYSDEILHAAKLSPVKLTSRLTDAEIARLYEATRSTLAMWIERLRAEAGEKFPEKVTAFRPGMAVHGRFGQPCPACGSPVQRIVYADNETNYCARCQTEGKLLADRALSRLLHSDWPRSLDDVE